MRLYGQLVDLSIKHTAAARELTVSGELDLVSADEFAAAGLGALDDPASQQLRVDLSAVSFIDSTGIGALIRLRNAAQEGSTGLVLVSPSTRVLEVLRLLALDDVFDIEPA